MAQKKIANIGLSENGIYLTEVPADGLPPEISTMDYIGDIVPDSLNRDDEEDTSVVLKSQESGEVFADILSETGAKKFTFATRNWKTENLLKALGGSVDATGSWLAPTSTFRGDFYAMAYMSRPDEFTGLHMVMQYPKVKLKGKVEGGQTESESNNLAFEGVVFTPENASGVKQAPMVYSLIPTAPTGGIVDDDNNTFAWTDVPGFTGFAKYEFSEDGGTTWDDCIANPHVLTLTAVAIGDMQIRVMADTTSDTKHKAGFVLANTEAFTT